MLTNVKIKNFKSIGDPGVELELKPLTILVGPNGSGKSSILEALAAAIQAQGFGRGEEFPTWEIMLHKPGDAPAIIEVEFFGHAGGIRRGFRLTVRVGRTDTNYLSEDGEVQQADHLLHEELKQRTFLISSVRGVVPYSVVNIGGPPWVGGHGEGLILALSRIFAQGNYDRASSQIRHWAHVFGLGDLRAGLQDNLQFSSDYLDPELEARLKLAVASAGARQILAVITQLFWAPPGSLLLIEEPEISLHPEAQVKLVEMFAEAIKEDKQIILTTHSSLLVMALNRPIQKGTLAAKDVAIYDVTKGTEGTKVERLELNEKGYIKGWIPSFRKVEQELMVEWGRSLPRTEARPEA